MPIHSISRCSNTLYTYEKGVGCHWWGFVASIMTPQHHTGSIIPHFPFPPKFTPTCTSVTVSVQVSQCEDWLICPYTAYQGAKTHGIHMAWMWDAVYGVLQPQPWPYNISWAQPYITFLKIHSHLHKCNSVRADSYAHPRLISQGAKTLCIQMIWMWDAVYSGLESQPWPYNITLLLSLSLSLSFSLLLSLLLLFSLLLSLS